MAEEEQFEKWRNAGVFVRLWLRGRSGCVAEFILIMLGYQNLKSRSRASSSSSGSEKIMKPEKIERIVHSQLHTKDLF